MTQRIGGIVMPDSLAAPARFVHRRPGWLDPAAAANYSERNAISGAKPMTPEQEQEIRDAIRQAAADGKVACKALLDLAAQTGAPPGEIGRLCDEMGLRIRTCQLGCFP